jgi:hypothetical protein
MRGSSDSDQIILFLGGFSRTFDIGMYTDDHYAVAAVSDPY